MGEKASRSSRLIVGLISGTSMDGIDAALVRISGPATQPRVRLIASETLPYPGWVRERLLGIASGNETTAEEIDQFNTLLGATFAEAAVRVCKDTRDMSIPRGYLGLARTDRPSTTMAVRGSR